MFDYIKAWLTVRMPKDEKGQDAAEYALLVGLIALIIVVGVGLFGNAINALFTSLATTVNGWF